MNRRSYNARKDARLGEQSPSVAPVDVLAVMDATVRARGSEWFRAHDKYFGRVAGIEKELDKLKAAENEAIEARAAVAELIEADKEYDKARRAWDDGVYTEWEGISDSTRLKVCADFEGAIARRAAALARVGGAS